MVLYLYFFRRAARRSTRFRHQRSAPRRFGPRAFAHSILPGAPEQLDDAAVRCVRRKLGGGFKLGQAVSSLGVVGVTILAVLSVRSGSFPNNHYKASADQIHWPRLLALSDQAR